MEKYVNSFDEFILNEKEKISYTYFIKTNSIKDTVPSPSPVMPDYTPDYGPQGGEKIEIKIDSRGGAELFGGSIYLDNGPQGWSELYDEDSTLYDDMIMKILSPGAKKIYRKNDRTALPPIYFELLNLLQKISGLNIKHFENSSTWIENFATWTKSQMLDDEALMVKIEWKNEKAMNKGEQRMKKYCDFVFDDITDDGAA
jgi:hypothetical protein